MGKFCVVLEGGFTIRTAYKTTKCTRCHKRIEKFDLRFDYIADNHSATIGGMQIRQINCLTCAHTSLQAALKQIDACRNDPEAFKLLASL